MSRSATEAYYDEVIAPQLAAIAEDCTGHGLSIIAAVEYSPGDYAETRKYVTEEISDALKLIQLAVMVAGNLDLLIMMALKLAAVGELDATNSVCVKILTQLKGD